MKKINAGKGLCLFLTAAALNLSCVSPFIPESEREEVRRKLDSGLCYMAAFEGFGAAGHARELVDFLSSQGIIIGKASAGNPATHMEFMEKSFNSGKLPYDLGFSAGTCSARDLARECKKKGIRIRILWLLDAVAPDTIPDNIDYVICYQSTSPYLFRGPPTREIHLENPGKTKLIVREIPDSSHLNLPGRVTEMIRQDIETYGRDKLNDAHGRDRLNFYMPSNTSLDGKSGRSEFDFRERERYWKSPSSSGIFQDWKGRVWRGRYFSRNRCS